MPVPLVVLNKYYSLTCLSDKALLKSLFRELVGKSQVGVLSNCVCVVCVCDSLAYVSCPLNHYVCLPVV